MKKRLKLIVPVFLIILLIMTTLTGFAVHEGFGTIYYESSYEIFNDARFGELVGNNSVRGIENAHFVEANISKGTIKPIVFSGRVLGTSSLEEMARYAEESGYKVLAGINGDFYDTKTGVPNGTVIHNGNIVTSGSGSKRVIVFAKDNKVTMANVGLRYSLKTKLLSKEYETEIFYFNVNVGAHDGPFIYNAHYSNSTKTSGDRIEVVIDVDDMQMAVNKKITGTIKSFHNSHNTPIGEKQFILSSRKNSPSGEALSKMQVGETIELSC